MNINKLWDFFLKFVFTLILRQILSNEKKKAETQKNSENDAKINLNEGWWLMWENIHLESC